MRSDISNPNRIASNLATNQLTFEMLCEHPQLGVLGKRYLDAHLQGLSDTSLEMSTVTAEALGAGKFVAALKELLTTERAMLLSRDPSSQQAEASRDREERNKDRGIGWQDEQGIYLLVNTARQAVERLLGFDALAKMSMSALYKQLADLGYLAETLSSVTKCFTRVLRMRGASTRVLHLRPDAFEDAAPVENCAKQPQSFDDIPF